MAPKADMARTSFTVTELNAHIKQLLDADALLGNVCVTGELSNYKVYPSGHHYFTLKDAESSLRCVMFRSSAQSLRFRPASGMSVAAVGRIAVYPRDGAYQLYCTRLIPGGVGDLYAAYEQLKEQLQKEGLFDRAHKKPLPAFPQRIAVITSSAGAAVRDIIRVLGKRWPNSEVVLLPVRVQGTEAPAEIAGAIRYANRYQVGDLIITGRGGGSMEDLWAFNEEIVARAIYRSRIPVISAVGHEIDFTIADFVADRRAETPTAAAEMAVPDIRELMQRAESWQNSLMADLKKKVSYADLRAEKLFAEMRHVLQGRVNAYRHELESCRLLLDENHPYRVLRKGYAVLEDAAGRNLASISDLRDGQSYRLKLKDGSATFRVTELAVTKEKRNDDI